MTSLDSQTFNNTPVLDVLADNLVNVGFVNVGVPDAFRIYHQEGSCIAAIQTPCSVDAYVCFAIKAQLLDTFFCITTYLLRMMVVATVFPLLSLVDAKEHMLPKVTHVDSELVGELVETNTTASNISAASGQISLIHRVRLAKFASCPYDQLKSRRA